MKPLKEGISITLDRDVIENIKALAEEQDRSVSQYINLVLKGHLKRLAEKGAKK
ncbi:MAG: ribbon-helix-helix protein, CopG family [Clostridia bacterium]|nr:ribbon-helix-helix protein, CopG family [Clostridia bacterium]